MQRSETQRGRKPLWISFHTASGAMPRKHSIFRAGGKAHVLRSQGHQAIGLNITLTLPGPSGSVRLESPAPQTTSTGEPQSAATCASPESLLTVNFACEKIK